MKFSACWIVKNEAENIQESIMSVKDCCEELIVVDTGSDDDTVKIANECGARVEHFEWISDFSAARNYALSLAKGEFVIFIDADEYFDPPLTKENRKEFLRIFRNKNVDTLRIPRYEVDKKSNVLKGIYALDRVLRKSAVHYEKKVHEVPRRKGSEAARFGFMGNYKLVHTGYTSDIVEDKAARNTLILESEQSRLTDPVELFMNNAYLIREYTTLGEYDKAVECCKYLLDHTEHQKDICGRHHIGYLQRFYQAINVIGMFPDRFNRKEVYDKLFCVIKEYYPDTRDAVLADLLYQYKMYYREDQFLREIIKVEPLLEKMSFSEILDCRQVESDIFELAAEAAHMRGDSEHALRWAQHSMRFSQTLDPRPLQIMLYHLRGNPPDIFADFICELVDMQNPSISAIVMWILNADEYREVYNLMLERGMPEAADDKKPAKRAIGAGDTDRIAVFQAKAGMCNARMKYAEISHDPDADFAASRSFICACHVAHSRIMLKEYSKAYDVILPYISIPDYNLLRFLLVIAENGEGRLAENARKRYDKGVAALDA